MRGREANHAVLAELKQLAIRMMLENQKRLHLEKDPMEYVRERIRTQAEDNLAANLRALFHVR